MGKIIYTDGACKGNPGYGGWSFVVVSEEQSLIKDIYFNVGNKIIDDSIQSWKLKRLDLSCNKIEHIQFGGHKETTNNRMEITAILESLKYCKENKLESIKILSDSAYCVNTIKMGWINNWVKNNWKTSSGEKVKNDDLLKQVWEFCNNKNIDISHIKGHSVDVINNLADKIADKASSFYQGQ